MLTADQLKTFNEQGYVTIPDLFSTEEVDAMTAEVGRLKELDHPQRLLETDNDLVRAIYAVEDRSEVLQLLTRDPRLVEATRAMLRDDVYIHQTQVSPKMAFRSAAWEWHQDFLYWSRDDAMPTSNVLSVGIFLDDVTEFNGPMFVVKGSHRLDLDQVTSWNGEGWEKTARVGDKYQLSPETLSKVIDKSNLTSVKGTRGTAVFFHGGLLHCSSPNLSPWHRTVLFVRYNAMGNALGPVADPRPEWLANRHPEVVEPLDGPFLGRPHAPAAS